MRNITRIGEVPPTTVPLSLGYLYRNYPVADPTKNIVTKLSDGSIKVMFAMDTWRSDCPIGQITHPDKNHISFIWKGEA